MKLNLSTIHENIVGFTPKYVLGFSAISGAVVVRSAEKLVKLRMFHMSPRHSSDETFGKGQSRDEDRSGVVFFFQNSQIFSCPTEIH